MDMRERFTYVYDNNVWGGSGGGSDMKLMQPLADWLNGYIAEQGITKMLDFGCGMSGFGQKIMIDKYIGVDVVRSVVEHCAEQFPDLDIRLSMGMPNIKADLILVKDVLIHWNVAEVNEFLQYVKTRYKHIVLVNSNGQTEDNPTWNVPEHLQARALSYNFEPLSLYSPKLVMLIDGNPNDIKEVILI